MRKNMILMAVAMLLSASPGKALVGDAIHSFKAPGSYPTGLTYDGVHLWVADRKSDLLYQIDTKDGKILKTLHAPGFSPTGLTWDGTHLWCIDDKEKQLYRINTASGTAERIIEAYTDSPKDICWDGKLLWLVDDKLDLILSVDPEDGMMIRNFPSPARDPDGLTFDGTYLWVTDRVRDMIYRVHPESGQVIMSLHAPERYARGLAWDGAHLWNADYQSDRIYQIRIDDPDFLSQREAKKQQLELVFDFRNYGPGKVSELDAYIAVPTDRDNQKLLSDPAFDPKPADFVTDAWGQRFAHYHIENLRGGGVFQATMRLKATIMSTEYHIDPLKVGSLEQMPEEIRGLYLADGKKLMMTDPYIQNLALQISGDEKNPYWIARRIYQYLIDQLSYNLKPVGGWNPAPTVLKRGTASCSEYSFSFIALCRSVGLPARYVGAVSLRGDDASLDEVFHRWCEVYLPNYGWIPFDANKGDNPMPADQAAGIGNVAARYVITTTSGGDSDYMDWTYNVNYHWKSIDKCRVYVEYYGDWSPLE